MSYINIHKKFKLSLVFFLVAFALIITSAFFIFHDQKTLAENTIAENNILVGHDYVLPEIAKTSIDGLGVDGQEQRQIILPMLMYHYISAAPANTGLPGLYTESEIFENHLQTLKEYGYHTVFPSDLGNYLISGEPLPDHSIILSFDDGYVDFYEKAFPLLKKYNMKGIIYVIYDYMDKPGYITVDQAKEMVDSGLVEIGSHTLNHINLSQTDAAEAYRQIYESKINLSLAIGREVTSIAYPFGKFSERDEGFAQKAGYLTGASTYIGARQSTNKIYSLFRIRPGKKINGDFIKLLEKEEAK